MKTKIREKDIKDPEFFAKRGVEKFNNNEYESSIEDFNKAISFDPENSYYYNLRGHARFSNGDSKGARADFNKSKKLKTKSKKQRKLLSL